MPTKVTIESGTIRKAEMMLALARVRSLGKKPQWKWNRGKKPPYFRARDEKRGKIDKRRVY